MISRDAEDDITGIYQYVATHDSVANAERLLNKLEKPCLSLAALPLRGNIPMELREIGGAEYREMHFKPYRIIYRTHGQNVIIYCVLDGRCDMQNVLLWRQMR